MKAPRITAALVCSGLAANLMAGTTLPASDTASGILIGRLAEGSPYERLMSVPVLYQNNANPWVQQLAIVGQLQTQYAYGSDATGKFGTADTPEDCAWGNLEVRRMRLGMKARLFNKLFFLNLTELYPDFSPRIYKRTPETYLTWMANDAFNISAGKTELKFNREQERNRCDTDFHQPCQPRPFVKPGISHLRLFLCRFRKALRAPAVIRKAWRSSRTAAGRAR